MGRSKEYKGDQVLARVFDNCYNGDGGRHGTDCVQTMAKRGIGGVYVRSMKDSSHGPVPRTRKAMVQFVTETNFSTLQFYIN